MNRNDYTSGPHHFWTHFWCGFVFGAGLGLHASWQIFDRIIFIVLGTAGTALVVACACGRWGDSAWYHLIEFLFWWL